MWESDCGRRAEFVVWKAARSPSVVVGHLRADCVFQCE